MPRRLVLIALLVAAALPASLPSAATAVAENAAAPQQLLVGYKIGTSEAAKQIARQGVQAEKLSTVVRGNSGQNAVELVRFPVSMPIDAAIRAFEANPSVLYAEPNWVVTIDATSNDPYFTQGSLWGMYGDGSAPNNQYGSQAAEAWANGKIGSTNVYIGIIDEGFDYNHVDLATNVWTNQKEGTGRAGVDDDGNGYVDDIHGWDFYNNDNSIYDPDAFGKGDEHGTHVAGTIGAIGNNGLGVAGVAWNVTLISGKFLGPSGGYISDAVSAVDYFVDLKLNRGVNVVALNNSWGGGSYSASLHAAIIRAANANILFIAAAGNSASNNDTKASYPSNYNSSVNATSSGVLVQRAASYDNVIAVASITNSGSLSSFSSYGSTTVDLGAPGSGIISTVPGNAYASYNGTSMATPHVTGAAALISAATASAATAKFGSDLRAQILSSVTAYPALNGKVATNGRLDLSSLGNSAPVADTTKPLVSLTSSATSIATGKSVTLTASASDNVGVTKVEFYQGSSSTPFAIDTTAPYSVGTTSSTAGTYSFTAKASDAAGNSATSSPPVSVTWTTTVKRATK